LILLSSLKKHKKICVSLSTPVLLRSIPALSTVRHPDISEFSLLLF